MKHREEKNLFIGQIINELWNNSKRCYITCSLIARLVKNLPAMQETLGRSLGQEDPLKKRQATTPVFLGFPCGSAGKESTCNAGDLSSVPGLGRSPREGKGYPHQYSGQENSMDCIVHGVTKSRPQLCDFHFHFSKEEGSRRTPKEII